MDDVLKKRIDVGIEEAIIFLLIVLGIFEFAGLLPADLDYVEKIISWLGLGYIFYKTDLTEVIFGYKDRLIDISLVVAYFLLVAKDFVIYSKLAIEEIGEKGTSFLVPLYTFILDNAFRFQEITFYVGGGIIILLALLNLFLNVEIKEPSMMSMFFREGPARTLGERISRAMASFIIYAGFFVVVFNLIFEWFGWAIDSTILVAGIFFYIFFFMRHFRKLHTESILYRIGDFGEECYEKFIRLFHSKNTVFFGFSGLLVIHLLTDVGNFIVPYIMGKKINYFSLLGAGHTVIPQLMAIDLDMAATLAYKISVVLVYAFNIMGILLLFLGPAYIWYVIYMKKEFEVPNIIYGLFFGSLFALVVSPIFKIQMIGADELYGVDILTNTITVSGSMMVMIAALIITVIIYILSHNHIIRIGLKYISVVFVEAFFTYYVFLFFRDMAGFYAKSLVLLTDHFLLFYMLVFLIITLFFYTGGIIYFVYTTFRGATKRFI